MERPINYILVEIPPGMTCAEYRRYLSEGQRAKRRRTWRRGRQGARPR